jgi:hypothetical protein
MLKFNAIIIDSMVLVGLKALSWQPMITEAPLYMALRENPLLTSLLVIMSLVVQE